MVNDEMLKQLARQVDAILEQVTKNCQTMQELQVVDADLTAELVETFDALNAEIRELRTKVES